MSCPAMPPYIFLYLYSGRVTLLLAIQKVSAVIIFLIYLLDYCPFFLEIKLFFFTLISEENYRILTI